MTCQLKAGVARGSYPRPVISQPRVAVVEGLERRALLSAATVTAAVAEFPIPAVNSQTMTPTTITAGPDGNLWFGGLGPPYDVGRVTTAGAVTQYTIPKSNGYNINSDRGITAGPDGNVWFTDQRAVGVVTPAGAATVVNFYANNVGLQQITRGPDGAMWFTEYFGNKIGRITTGGAVTEFTIPTAQCRPVGITAGPDGNLWFTESASSKIGRMTTGGTFSEFVTMAVAPAGITAGPDGNLWFASKFDIGKTTPAGQITLFRATGTSGNNITSGPDDALWFTPYFQTDPIGRITTAGAVTTYPVPTPNAFGTSSGITAGPDGNIWFTEGAKKIGRITLNNSLPGDANKDGKVNFGDLLLLAQHYGRDQQTWGDGDFNDDGKVNFSDLLILAQNYGKSGSAASDGGSDLTLLRSRHRRFSASAGPPRAAGHR